MSKIVFFAHDPGGANAISPLIKPLQKKHTIFVYAKGPAKRILGDLEIGEDTLSIIKPDLLITGTSANDMTEKLLWQETKKLNIKSLAILDHWFNYGIRFSKYCLNEIQLFNKKPTIFPDYIVVMDEYAKEQMILDGVPSAFIKVLGNPHFAEVKNTFLSINNLRERFVTDEEKLITYFSESSTEDYGQGYERLVLSELVEFYKNKGNCKIVVKLHPRDNIFKYDEFKNDVIIEKDITSLELIKACDLVVSMTSMVLIEALIAGKTSLSYQPFCQSPEKFILTKRGILPFINNKEDFFKFLNVYPKIDFNSVNKLSDDVIENNINFIESIIQG